MSGLLSGYIDKRGSFVIPATFRTARTFVSGVAWATGLGGRTYGFLGGDGGWVMEPRAHFIGRTSNGITPYNVGGAHDEDGRLVGGTWGWAGHGAWLCKERFERVGRYNKELIAVRQDGRWGFADRTGQICIAPQFEWAGAFGDEGLAVALADGRAGFIGPDGQWRIEPKFEDCDNATDNKLRIRRDQQWYYADLHGRPISEGFDSTWPFQDGMAKVRRGEQYALVGPDAQVLGGHWFDEVDTWADGLAPVRRGEDWYGLDAHGNLHGPFSTLLNPNDGLARFVDDQGVGFLDAHGNKVIPGRYQSAQGFRDGWAPVKREDKWTFVNAQGGELHAPQWDAAVGFDEGLAPVRKDGKWGAIDTSGALAIPCRFASLEQFSEGLAAAQAFDVPTQVAIPSHWHCTPEGGLDFRGFEGATRSDEVRVTFCFAPNLEPDQSLVLAQLVDKWTTWLEPLAHGALSGEGEPWISDYAATIRIKNVDDPVGAIRLLVAEVAQLGLPIKEVTFGRFAPDPEASPLQSLHPVVPAVPHPDDPRGPSRFPTFDAYLEACFDLDGPQPRSESAQQLLSGRWLPNYTGIAYGERSFTLHHPQVRICYGITQEGFLPDDDRSDEVAAAMIQAVTDALGPQRVWNFPSQRRGPLQPQPLRRDSAPGVEKLRCGNRTGYLFGIEPHDILQDIGPRVFRYRDAELMDAVATAIGRLGLAPLILWQRFGQPMEAPSAPGIAHPHNPQWYILNVWERD